jgi:phage terminase small subunit
MADERPLSPKQQAFVDEYLKDLNATAALVRAGYSAKTADVQASQTLRIPKVQAAIASAMARRAARCQFDQDSVLHELALLSRSDIMDYVIDDEGNVGLREGAHPDATRAIASLKRKIHHSDAGVTYETTITLWSKPASVKMAAEHLGLLVPAQAGGSTTVNILVQYAPARA